MTIEKSVAQKLISKKKTLSIAESCTGGLLSHRLTNIPGSSQFLKLGLVVYANEVKTKLLKVPAQIIKKHGAVSPQTAKKMAQNIRKILNTDFGVAITGIAGPTGATRTKPVGLTFIALSTASQTQCHRFIFKGYRASIKSQAAKKALYLLNNSI